jgi:hypothetical protein
MSDTKDRYDVFLSYNSADQLEVNWLREKLLAMHLTVFMDLWELRPGFPVQEKLSRALENAKSVAVVVGSTGIGRWQQVEFESALGEQVGGSGRPVIPIILQGVLLDKVPLFLRRENRIDFSTRSEEDELSRLYWGITGEKPVSLRPAEVRKSSFPPSGLTPLERAVNTLKVSLKSTNITFFVGGRNSPSDPSFPPDDAEIAGNLLKSAGLVAEDENSPPLPIDTAASYFEIQRSPSELEGHVGELIVEKPTKIPPVLKSLANLLLVLQRYRKPRGGGRSRQLIVTTNPDVGIERALLTQALPFGRVIQHMGLGPLYVSSFTSIHVNRGDVDPTGEEVDEQLAGVPKSDIDPRELSLESLPEIILYKLRGSYDCYGTCALSTEQYLKFHIGAIERNLIPKKISEIVQQTPIVLLNYSYLDPDYRLASYTLLAKARETTRDPIYAVQKAGTSSWPESALWERLKIHALEDRRITTIEEEGEFFLKVLMNKLQEGIP